MLKHVGLEMISGQKMEKHEQVSHLRTMVLEYAHQHMPLSKISRFLGKYTSTMVRIWVLGQKVIDGLLVGGIPTPLKNMRSSVGAMKFPFLNGKS